MKPKIIIAIVGELGYYKATTIHNGFLIESAPRITLIGAFNSLGLQLHKETGVMLTDHPFTINYQPEAMPGIDKPKE